MLVTTIKLLPGIEPLSNKHRILNIPLFQVSPLLVVVRWKIGKNYTWSKKLLKNYIVLILKTKWHLIKRCFDQISCSLFNLFFMFNSPLSKEEQKFNKFWICLVELIWISIVVSICVYFMLSFNSSSPVSCYMTMSLSDCNLSLVSDRLFK